MEDYNLFHTKKEYEQTLYDYFSAGQYQEALYYLEQIENKVIDTVWLNFNKGRLYNALNQYHLALTYLLIANQQSDDSVTLFSEMGWTFNRLEHFDEALKYLEACICMEREDYWLFSELAYTYLKKEMWEEAIVYLHNALEFKEDDHWALEQLANAYSQTGHYDKANEVNLELLKQDENDEALLEDIITLNEMNETLTKQAEYLDKLMTLAKDKTFVYYHFGVYYNSQLEYLKAIEILNKIPLHQRVSETWIELGYALHQTNQILEAIEAYEKAYEMDSFHLFLLSELAYLYGVIHDYQHKLFYLDEAYRCGRRDTWIYLNYVRVYLYDIQDFSKAHDYLVAVEQIAQEDEEVQFLWSEYEWFNHQEIEAHQRLLQILTKRLHQQLPTTFNEVSWQHLNKKAINIPDLERVYQFSEGLAYVEDKHHGGFINEQGELVIDLKLALDETKRQDTFMFKNGYAIIHQDTDLLYGLINQDGDIIVDLMYDELMIYEDHIRLNLGTVTILEFENKQVVFEETVGIYKQGLIPILKETNWYYCDLAKNIQINQAFMEAEPFHQGKAIVKIDGYGLINRKGEVLLPFIYESLGWIDNQLIAKKDGLYGLIEGDGTLIIDYKWEDLQDGYEGYLRVQQNGLWGLIDKTNKQIIPCIYEAILPVFEERVRVEKEGCFGMCDLTGQLIIPIIYDTLTICKENKIIAGVGYRYGYMDKIGHLLTPFMFQTATLPVHHIYSVSYQNQFYLIDDGGELNENND